MGGFWDESPRAQTCSLLMALQGEQYSLNNEHDDHRHDFDGNQPL